MGRVLFPGGVLGGGGPAGLPQSPTPDQGPIEERIPVNSVMVVCGMRIAISRFRRHGSFTAELVFDGEGGTDRAVVDAATAEELESLIAAVAYPAALARRSAAEPALPAPPAGRYRPV